MSRIGSKPVPVPAAVQVALSNGTITVRGAGGELSLRHHPRMQVSYDAGARVVRVARPDDARENRALHGLTRALINNMVDGVQKPFEKRLEVVGVGYQASLKGKQLALQVGYANTVLLDIPPLVTCEVPSPTAITLKSPDKQAVGQFAAEIRRVRPPEPYKGKGIKFQGEVIRRKAGKAFGSGS
jgi:large subunit ribosomal protein L6